MSTFELHWQRFADFAEARKAFRGRCYIYMQTDPQENALRVGESDDLWKRYFGGTAYALAAVMHGSRNLFFVASAPARWGAHGERRHGATCPTPQTSGGSEPDV